MINSEYSETTALSTPKPLPPPSPRGFLFRVAEVKRLTKSVGALGAVMFGYCTKQQVTPQKFNSSPLKNGGWKTILSYWEVKFSGAMLHFQGVNTWKTMFGTSSSTPGGFEVVNWILIDFCHFFANSVDPSSTHSWKIFCWTSYLFAAIK